MGLVWIRIASYVLQHGGRGALRQMIRSSAQGGDRLPPGAKASGRHSNGYVCSRGGPARWTNESVQLILRHDRLHRRQFRHLMALGLKVLAVQGVLAAEAVQGLEREHRIHVLQWHQYSGLALLPWLPSGRAATGR